MIFALAAMMMASLDEASTQRDMALDQLMNCWAGQWPTGVALMDDAKPGQIAEASRLTRQNCAEEIRSYSRAVQDDLRSSARLQEAELERAAAQIVETDLNEMFDEYWSRL